MNSPMSRLLALAWLFAIPAIAAPPAPAKTARVSVLYFDVQSTQEALKVFNKGLSELMIADLAQSTDLTVVERSRLEEILAELKLGETRYADPATAAKIGKLVGAQFMVAGTIVENPVLSAKGGPGRFKLLVKIIDVEHATVVPQSTIKVDLDPDDVFGAEEAVVKEIAKFLVTAGKATQAGEPAKKAHKLPVGTAVKYSKALDAKDKKNKDQAVKLLNEVVKEQPDFKLAQLDLLTLTK